ncbi:Gypsy retrotransposon integrase-like protein 1 [Collichthys lucidus]|uniref:Gypsy retrotransposon integrase-like protein 1 n=1 Tax=Collichthys lucidus TaxID=240159 RepID=A0A4U5UTQ1_COLLU|nr:Gypsy retrotransposon integrase-like protein 1 [Collichthys lucidus]
MLSVESLQVAEEEVVVSSSNKLGDIYTFVSKGCFPQTMNPLRKKNLKRFAQKFIIDEDKLYYVGPKKEEKREVVIDAERKRQIFLDCHFNDIGYHLGQKKTVHRIQSKYYWLGIIKDVVDWIKVCETCQHTERNKNLARTVRPIKVDAPWDVVGIDLLGPFPETQQGNTNVTLIVDYFSKWAEAFPVQKTDALSVARCISKCIYRFGSPKTIVCTQNGDFSKEVTKLLYTRWSIVQKVAPLDEPQLNPLHDCTCPLLKEAIVQMVTEKQADWDDFLDPVLFLFRTSTNPTTKFSPYSLMFNRKANLSNEMTLNLLHSDGQEQDMCSTNEKASSFMSIMQEQQNSVKQLVIANMNAAYKQEKKNAKRRTHNMPSMTFKVTDPLFGGDSPSPKKLKESLYLSFPVETVLATEQSGSDIKTELTYHLVDSDVH